jgi:hypothetical protein
VAAPESGDARDLARYDEAAKALTVTPGEIETEGASSCDLRLRGRVRVESVETLQIEHGMLKMQG